MQYSNDALLMYMSTDLLGRAIEARDAAGHAATTSQPADAPQPSSPDSACLVVLIAVVAVTSMAGLGIFLGNWVDRQANRRGRQP